MYYPIRTIDDLRSSKLDFLQIGASPASEPCVELGEDLHLAFVECEIYIDQLIRRLGQPPTPCYYFIFRGIHESLPFHEAAIAFDLYSGQHVRYALKAYSGDDRWDEIAQREIIEKGVTAARRA